MDYGGLYCGGMQECEEGWRLAGPAALRSLPSDPSGQAGGWQGLGLWGFLPAQERRSSAGVWAPASAGEPRWRCCGLRG